ncbi:MAG: tRNA (adenosine(37)-N6)-dimethylallyltransferase MiaA [Treponema sp.]|nr:tRNA (adenosine(37)-N6)-dimethylallyltransferase MiaA [Treponema sp.]
MSYNCVVILGPTAVGKTAVGVSVAHHFGGEVISADSRQTYKGLDIGSGKDLCEYEVDGVPVPYHLIDITTLETEYNVFNYQTDFYRVFEEIRGRGKLPVVVGGTGMYLDSVVRGYDLITVPENPELHESLEKRELSDLAKELLSIKPDLHNKSDLLEKDRVIKALEIALYEQSEEGKAARESLKRPDIRPLIIGTTLERSQVVANIERRLKERLDEGMIEEIEGLHNAGASWERLEKLGLEYRYCSLFLEGKIATKEELFEQLFIQIRQFSKRQMTWYRGMEKKGVKINWLTETPDKKTRIDEAIKLIEREGVEL